MSREVDERVVELQFRNSDFEKNTKQSIRSIDRLMEKLQFKGAEKGFANLQKASDDVDLSGIDGQIEKLKVSFNALDVVAVAALTRITNKIIDTGEQLVKSLSVDQIASGWTKYTQKTGSIQTIMNATGKSIDEVNGYLSKLMWFSDETSYGFTDMTSALATLTSNGGKIEKLIPMIEGIANATAYAGKGATEFSRAIFNLSQSYGTGALQLIDWKSVEQAGVSSEQLKQTLIDTAVELGKLKKGEVTTGTFDSTLQKKWATTEVMEKGFAKFSALTEAAYQAVNTGEYDTASEAIEALADSYDDVAVKAFKSAQEAKSFGEAIDATKDAVSSGWMKIFETIFGNKDEATKTWTELANRLYDVFVPPIENLQERLREGLDSGWQRFLDDEMGEQGASYAKILEDLAVKSGAITKEALTKAGGVQEAMKQGLLNASMISTTLDKATKDIHEVLGMSDEDLAKYGKTREEVQAIADAYDKLNERIASGDLDLKQYEKDMRSLSGREHLIQGLWNIWDAIAKVMNAVHTAFKTIFPPKTGEEIRSVAEGFDNLTKKLVISDETAAKIQSTFTGVFGIVKMLLTPVRQLVKLGKTAVELLSDAAKPVADTLLTITAGLGDFGEAVAAALTGSGSFGEKLDSIKMAAKQLLSPLENLGSALQGTTLVSGFTSWFESLSEGEGLLTQLAAKAKDILSGLSPVFGRIADKGLTMASALETAFYGMVTGIGELGRYIRIFVLTQLPSFDEIAASIAEMPQRIGTAWTEFTTGFKSELDSLGAKSDDALTPITDFFAALKAGLDSVSGTDIYRLLSLIDVGMMAYSVTQVAKAFKSFKDLLKDPLTNLLDSAAGSFKALSSAIKTWEKNKNVNFLKVMATSILMLAGALYVMSLIDMPHLGAGIAAIGAGFIALSLTAKSISKSLTALDPKTLASLSGMLMSFSAAILAMSIGIASITKSLTKLTSVLTTGDVAANVAAFASGIFGLVTVMLTLGHAAKLLEVEGGKVIGAKVLVGMAAQMIALGTAIRIVASAVKPLSEIETDKGLSNGVNAVIALGFALTAMAGVMAMVQKKIGGSGFQNGAAVAAMAGGIWIAAQAVYKLGTLSADKLENGVQSVKTLMLMMTVLSTLSNKTGFRSGAAVLSMAVAIDALVIAVTALGALPYDVVTNGLIRVGIAIAAMTTGLAVLGALWKGDFSTGAAIVALSSSLLILAGACAVFAAVDWDGLKKAAVSLLTLSVGAVALSHFGGYFTQAATGMLAMSSALLVFAVGVRAMKDADPEAVGQGLQVLLDGMLIMMLGGALLTAMPALAAGLGMLSKAFWNFAKAIGVLSLAAAALGVLALFAGPVCQAIVAAAPDIQAALIAVVTVLCNTIVACAEPLALALAALGTAAIIAIVQVIANLWEMCKPALDDLWSKFQAWMAEHNPLDPSVWINGTSSAAAMKKNSKIAAGSLFAPFYDILDELQHGDSLTAGIYQTFAGVGKNVAEGTKKGVEDGTPQVANAATDMANAAVDATKTTLDSHSPSKVFVQIGDYIPQGMVLGIQNGQSALMTAMQTLSEKLRNVFTDFWGIHSPSDQAADDTENILEGMILGMTDGQKRQDLETSGYNAALALRRGILNGMDETVDLVQQRAVVLYNAMKGVTIDPANPLKRNQLSEAEKYALDPGKNAIYPGKNGLTTDLNKRYGTDGKKIKTAPQDKSALDNLLDSMKKIAEDAGLPTDKLNKMLAGAKDQLLGQAVDYNAFLEQWKEDVADAADEAAGTTPTSKTKSGGTEKTPAEKLAEEYQKKLKANKYLQDAATKEKELWDATAGNTANAAEKSNKETEALAKQIELQNQRVALAQEQYDKLLKEAPDDDKTKDAYATLLDEKTSLATLQNERIDKVYSELLDDYDDQADRADLLYKQWSTANSKTAKASEKEAKNLENIQRKTEIARVKAETAKQKWEVTAQELGAASTEAKQAEEDWIKADTEHQELINEYNEATIDALEAQRNRIDTEMKAAEQRQELLEKLYSDGDLSGRKSAYESAVKEYGKDSKEAKKAATQGTMSSILAVGNALRGMSKNLRKLTAQQQVYNEALQQAGGDKSNETVMTAREDLEDLRYGFVELAGEFAAAFDMDDTGQKLCMQLGNAIAKNWPEIQNGFKQVMQNISPALKETLGNVLGAAEMDGSQEAMAGVLNVIVSAVQGDWGSVIVTSLTTLMNYAGSEAGQALLSQIGTAVAGGGGIEGILATLGPALLEFLPYIAIAVAALASIGYVVETVKSEWDDSKSDFENIMTGIAKSVRDMLLMVSGPIGWIGLYLIKKAEAAKKAATDAVDQINQSVTEAADRMDGILTSDTDYEPRIRPVYDLSDAVPDLDTALPAEQQMALSRTVTLAAQATVKKESPEPEKEKGDPNQSVVDAVTSLGGRIDDLGAKMSNLKVVMNSKKLVGEIKGDMNTALAKG